MKRTFVLLAIIIALIGIGYMAYSSFAEEAAVQSPANAEPSASSAASLIP
jgi:uncharacterized protein (UPF0333 family)